MTRNPAKTLPDLGRVGSIPPVDAAGVNERFRTPGGVLRHEGRARIGPAGLRQPRGIGDAPDVVPPVALFGCRRRDRRHDARQRCANRQKGLPIPTACDLMSSTPILVYAAPLPFAACVARESSAAADRRHWLPRAYRFVLQERALYGVSWWQTVTTAFKALLAKLAPVTESVGGRLAGALAARHDLRNPSLVCVTPTVRRRSRVADVLPSAGVTHDPADEPPVFVKAQPSCPDVWTLQPPVVVRNTLRVTGMPSAAMATTKTKHDTMPEPCWSLRTLPFLIIRPDCLALTNAAAVSRRAHRALAELGAVRAIARDVRWQLG